VKIEKMRALAASPATAGVLVVVLGLVYLIRSEALSIFWVETPATTFVHEIGFAYEVMLGSEELSSHEGPSPARLQENGRALGPADSQHAFIRDEGRGRYSFWHDYVIFSTSDNTDPRTNGRRYGVLQPPITRAWAAAIYVIGGILLAVAVSLAVRRPGATAESRTSASVSV